jgi:hypothetical protein
MKCCTLPLLTQLFLSNSGTFSSEVKGLELVTAQGDILLVDEFSPLMPVMSCALGGGAMIRSIKLKTYQDQIFHVKKRLMELDEFLTSFDHLTSSHLSVFVNLFYHRGIPRFLVSQIDKEILGLNQNKDSELISKLEVFGVKSSKFIPSSVKNSLRYFVTKKFNPDYRVFGNSIHHALKTDTTEKRGFQRFEISSHEVCFPFEMHQELILSLVEELSKKWLELDSFYPINLRISGADEAFLSPSFGRKSLWVDFVMQDSKEMSLLREFETWHIVNNFGGRPHFGKYMNPERYDFSSLYSNLNLFVETINSLDPKGFFNSVLLEHV